jgi:hypothetical protein
MTLKHYTITPAALPVPVPNTLVVMDTGVTYTMNMRSTRVLDQAELYDWYIVEFTKPIYFS